VSLLDPEIAASSKPGLSNEARKIAIIGAGFSGTLLAVNLLNQTDANVVLIERAPERIGRGVAYSTQESNHLLNVRAGNMSAFPDDPNHFCNWLQAKGSDDPKCFVPRHIYGDYLSETLTACQARWPDRIRIVKGEAVSITEIDDAAVIHLADGDPITADRLVLSLGNLPPHDPVDGLRRQLSPQRYIADPWSYSAGAELFEQDVVLIIGTGLTAVDVILKLVSGGFKGKIMALSRRGLRPHRHIDGLPRPEAVLERPAQTLSGISKWLRDASAGQDWRLSVDSIRPITQMIWSSLDIRTRQRFLRHARPFWDVHRHRIAPAVADTIDRLVAAGKLEFLAGKPQRFVEVAEKVIVHWRPRGDRTLRQIVAAKIINCTGPQGDVLRSDDAQIVQMLNAGQIRPDALRLGIDTDGYGYVIQRDGKASRHIMAVGPMTRSSLWEVVAVPDIRSQVSALARRVGNCHWVGGEGL
jgi:uncharacterized NAD(P)/FAD-binding protein YdhS